MKTLRNIALMAGLLAAPAYAGETTNDIPNGSVPTIGPTAPVDPVEPVEPVNNVPVWAEGQGNYVCTEGPITFGLKATDADGDALTYALPENWGQAPIEGGIQATYNGEKTALGETVTFTVTDTKSDPVSLDVALACQEVEEQPVVEEPKEPYALRRGFRLGPEYNFMTVKDGANYHLGGLRAAYDIPVKDNMLVSINASVGYANQGETRGMSSTSTDEVMVDSETGMQNLGDGQYLNWAGTTYESSETTRTWEEGRNGAYAGLGANVEFGRQVRLVTGLEGRVMFGSFADKATDVTSTTRREELSSYISENGEAITDVNIDEASDFTITESNSMHGNNVYGTIAVPLGVSADLGNFNLSAGIAGGLMINDGAQPYFGAGANVTYRFGKKE